MTEREKNIEYICSKTSLDKDDKLVPIILQMLSETYIKGLRQGHFDIQMDANLNDREELTADEMFEKLGYIKSHIQKHAGMIEDEYYYSKEHVLLTFWKDREVSKYSDETETSDYINMQELKAINKKVEELGWI